MAAQTPGLRGAAPPCGPPAAASSESCGAVPTCTESGGRTSATGSRRPVSSRAASGATAREWPGRPAPRRRAEQEMPSCGLPDLLRFLPATEIPEQRVVERLGGVEHGVVDPHAREASGERIDMRLDQFLVFLPEGFRDHRHLLPRLQVLERRRVAE